MEGVAREVELYYSENSRRAERRDMHRGRCFLSCGLLGSVSACAIRACRHGRRRVRPPRVHPCRSARGRCPHSPGSPKDRARRQAPWIRHAHAAASTRGPASRLRSGRSAAVSKTCGDGVEWWALSLEDRAVLPRRQSRIGVCSCQTTPQSSACEFAGVAAIMPSGRFDAATRRIERPMKRAHVPPGSIKRGELLPTTGGGKTTACIACHRPDLRGLADFPPLAGRSPS